MPIATAAEYAHMLDRAKFDGFAYPSINVTSSETLNAALRGFSEADSDGIVQVSTGGASFLSGTVAQDMVTGASALAQFAHVVARNYPVTIASHTDHCPKEKLDQFVRPLLATSQRHVAAGGEPLFQSHMWDGSALLLQENLKVAAELLQASVRAHSLLEIEIGVVGGVEDDVHGDGDAKLYSTPQDALRVAEAIGLGEHGRYLLAATFGNKHGAYKPGEVKLRPQLLEQIQEAVGTRYAKARPFDLVFHGASATSVDQLREAIGYGVVKVNLDTDMQYAFSRPIVSITSSRTTIASLGLTAALGRRTPTTRGPMDARRRLAWPPAWPRPVSTRARPDTGLRNQRTAVRDSNGLFALRPCSKNGRVLSSPRSKLLAWSPTMRIERGGQVYARSRQPGLWVSLVDNSNSESNVGVDKI